MVMVWFRVLPLVRIRVRVRVWNQGTRAVKLISRDCSMVSEIYDLVKALSERRASGTWYTPLVHWSSSLINNNIAKWICWCIILLLRFSKLLHHRLAKRCSFCKTISYWHWLAPAASCFKIFYEYHPSMLIPVARSIALSRQQRYLAC